MKTYLSMSKKLLLMGLIIITFSCNKEDDPTLRRMEENDFFQAKKSTEKVNIFKGPEVQYGSGKARSWISINGEGLPVEIGIEITPKVFDDLSELTMGHEESTVLPLHQKARELTPFEHIGLNYQPNGHGPIFWAEHFDFHFYTITNEERLAIPEYDANDQSIVDAFNSFPDMTKMPSDYFKFPGQGGVYAKMGKHWVPGWVPGQIGQPYNFTHVMILGSYAEKNNFIEPMVTVDYLLSGEIFSGAYSQPQTFEEPGNYYPTVYNIYHDSKNGNINISLSNFVQR